MSGYLSHSASTRPALSLGDNHGYRFEGDTAILNAELALSPALHTLDGLDGQAEHWALQLWACETPHQGGPLRGLKVAEAELRLPTHHDEHAPTRLETAAFARLPPTQGAYNMVLVLASGAQGRYDQVHDFSNYAARQQFTGPQLDGSVGYRFDGNEVVLQADNVRNTRDADNLSGSLAIELWALDAPYEGGVPHGTLLAQSDLGRLEGQGEQRHIEHRVALTQATPGAYRVALLLREWTEAAGYVTRDFCNFAASHVVAPREEPLSTTAELAPESAPSAGASQQQPAAEMSPAIAEQEVDAEPAISAAPVDAEPAISAAPVMPAEPTLVVESAATVEEVVTAAAVAEPAVVAAKAPPIALKAKPALASSAKPSAVAAVAPVATSNRARVSVQTASVDELAAVDGLNRKLAQAIVKARPFQALEDVVKVRGIGDKMLQRLREQLTL